MVVEFKNSFLIIMKKQIKMKINKQNCEFIINNISFYFLKPDSLVCILRLNINSLESIIISYNNFNLFLLSFKNSADIIIETFQRMELLIYFYLQ